MKVHGAKAASMYGVCCCEKATLINQVWIEEKSERILANGSFDITMRVICGFCRRPMGATE